MPPQSLASKPAYVRAQDHDNAAICVLPTRLTALTLLVKAVSCKAAVTAPLPQLTQLPALRRLSLRFELHGALDCSASVVLPALPTGLTHLTIGAHHHYLVAPSSRVDQPQILGQVGFADALLHMTQMMSHCINVAAVRSCIITAWPRFVPTPDEPACRPLELLNCAAT